MPLLLTAQHFRIEIGYSLLVNTQKGTAYTVDLNHVPTVYNKSEIDRRLFASGITATLYYPLNFGTFSFEKFSFGPQIGITSSASSLNASYDVNYRNSPDKPTLRIPVMLSIRRGSLNAVNQKRVGCALAAGVEGVQLNVADETGKFLLPVIQFKVGLKYVQLACNVYPMSIQSVYKIDGVETKRLNTKLIEFQFLIGFGCSPRRYQMEKNSK